MSAPSSSPFDFSSRRLAVYGYLGPLVAGGRVLEVGGSAGGAVARLRALGATEVLAVEADARGMGRAEGSFDLVLVPDGARLIGRAASLSLAQVQRACGPDGQLAVLIESGDRPGATGGAGYYDVVEALQASFPRVRMFGLTPFAAFGLAEFAEATSGLRIDGGLIEDAGEQPTHYLAIAGPDHEFDLGYALMQIPPGAEAAGVAAAGVETRPAAPDAADLRRRLAEAEGKAEGLVRVSRAQTEEIEELRARLRRGAESRAELDQEMSRLRRALAEADESVLDLTRRTTQEMASLAQRITSGLRSDGDAPTRDEGAALARAREELRRREEELAATESALSERDERVAVLEAERQDLDWRLAAAQAMSSSGRNAGPREGAARPGVDEGAAQKQRELALEQYRQAAAAHLDEVGRLREALAEQSTLVAELEDGLAASARKLASALEETERLRRHVAEVEEGDRARRSRLAEVEGTLLRLQRQAAMTVSRTDEVRAPAPNGTASAVEWERKLSAAHDDAERRVEAVQRQAQNAMAEAERLARTLADKIAALEKQLQQSDHERGEVERRWAEAVERTLGLERALADNAAAAPAVMPPAPSGETDLLRDDPLSDDRAPLGVADGPRLEAALREVSRLRETLERSEEQLWETKGQLLLDRERMAVLEHQLAEGPAEPTMTEAAHHSIMNAVYKELAELEYGVRAQIARLERVEKTVEGWRADAASGSSGGDANGGNPFAPVE
jgi:hypothetical protein